MATQSRRNLHIDLLRIIATLMIFTAHITTLIYQRPDFFGTLFWWLNHVVLSFSRIGTPLFFMMSGYLLADKQRSYNEQFRHTFLRLGIPFICFYILSNGVVSWIHNTPFFSDVLTNLFIGGGNYLYFLVGLFILYLLLPMLQTLFDSFSQPEMGRGILFLFLNTGLYTLGAYLISTDAQVPNHTFLYWFLTMGFFLYGMYLKKYPEKSAGSATKMLLLSSLPILFNIVISYFTQKLFVQSHGLLYLKLSFYVQSYLGLTIILSSALFFKGLLHIQLPGFIHRTRSLWEFFSKHSFGIYLVHMIILEYFLFRTPLTIDNGPFNAAIMLILIWSTLLAASFIFTFIVRKLPYVKGIVGE